VIVHISQPIIFNEVVQIDPKQSDTGQPPPKAAVNSIQKRRSIKFEILDFIQSMPATDNYCRASRYIAENI
jgi:hypothetical protein